MEGVWKRYVTEKQCSNSKKCNISDMKKADYRIISNERIACGVYRMSLEGDTSAMVRGGQFCDVAVDGFYLRRPLAVTEWDQTHFSIIYKVIGQGTEVMAAMAPGFSVNVLTGLGNGFDSSAAASDALVVCGGIGASPCFTLVKELLSRGVNVTVILGFNTADDVILEDEYRALGVTVAVATMDGSAGYKGLVTDVIDILKPRADYFYTCGPRVMMKAVCEKLPIDGQVSNEERMGCGCGICYGCTCHTKQGAKRVCADGPVFKKGDVIW